MDDKEVRLRLVEAVTPGLSRLEGRNPGLIVEAAKCLEQYVLGVYTTPKDDAPKRSGRRAAKSGDMSDSGQTPVAPSSGRDG